MENNISGVEKNNITKENELIDKSGLKESAIAKTIRIAKILKRKRSGFRKNTIIKKC